ncbi:hypothetical protein GIB67_042003, partial [Kingdonia uniflora]
TGITIVIRTNPLVIRTTEHLPWNFGSRVQVVRTTLNLIRTTLVKAPVSPRSSWIMAPPFRTGDVGIP